MGRKVRDLGMMVDLIFLNTEVSLTQALEDVSRGGSPFAIVITQQHQTHHSCTVNILCGTPQGTPSGVFFLFILNLQLQEDKGSIFVALQSSHLPEIAFKSLNYY